MKANAPEKIYIPRLEGNETFVHEWSATKFRKYFSREIAENVEYVRTDAFIEKACEYFRTKKKCVFACIGEDVYHSILNEEEIEDFKNYMKGE